MSYVLLICLAVKRCVQCMSSHVRDSGCRFSGLTAVNPEMTSLPVRKCPWRHRPISDNYKHYGGGVRRHVQLGGCRKAQVLCSIVAVDRRRSFRRGADRQERTWSLSTCATAQKRPNQSWQTSRSAGVTHCRHHATYNLTCTVAISHTRDISHTL